MPGTPDISYFQRITASIRDSRNEWWYFTGHVLSRQGKRLGFQFTLFRTEMAPPNQTGAEESLFRTNEIWMGHAAISDIEGVFSAGSPQFYHGQRLSRGGAGMAGEDNKGLYVGDWRAQWSPRDPDRWQITANWGEVSLELAMNAIRPGGITG